MSSIRNVKAVSGRFVVAGKPALAEELCPLRKDLSSVVGTPTEPHRDLVDAADVTHDDLPGRL